MPTRKILCADGVRLLPALGAMDQVRGLAGLAAYEARGAPRKATIPAMTRVPLAKGGHGEEIGLHHFAFAVVRTLPLLVFFSGVHPCSSGPESRRKRTCQSF